MDEGYSGPSGVDESIFDQQRTDQKSPDIRAILKLDIVSLRGTWLARKGRATQFCKSKVSIEEVLYFSERASITVQSSSGDLFTVPDLYAILSGSFSPENEHRSKFTVSPSNLPYLQAYIVYQTLRKAGHKVTRPPTHPLTGRHIGPWQVQDVGLVHVRNASEPIEALGVVAVVQDCDCVFLDINEVDLVPS